MTFHILLQKSRYDDLSVADCEIAQENQNEQDTEDPGNVLFRAIIIA